MRIALAIIALSVATPAYALSAYLVREWTQNGDQFCEYENGTILNVGARVCPRSIQQ